MVNPSCSHHCLKRCSKSLHRRDEAHNLLQGTDSQVPDAWAGMDDGTAGEEDDGTSRVVYAGPGAASFQQRFCGNDIHTAKYNVVTFVPVFLFTMFSRVAYLYFLSQVRYPSSSQVFGRQWRKSSPSGMPCWFGRPRQNTCSEAASIKKTAAYKGQQTTQHVCPQCALAYWSTVSPFSP